MKTKITRFRDQAWDLVTEVPGWPDAPRSWRIRRAVPLVLPFVAVLLLVGWNKVVRNPRLIAERAAHQSLTAMEEEIAALRLSCSDQEAIDIAARADAARRILIKDPQQQAFVLNSVKKEFESRRWKADLHAGEGIGDDVAESPDRQVILVPARARLTSLPGNPQAFYDLLAALKQLSAMGKRIDLTRLAVRADEQGRYAAELSLRLACFAPHEKTP